MKRFANPDLLSNARTDQGFDAVLTFFLIIYVLFSYLIFLKRFIYLFADLCNYYYQSPEIYFVFFLVPRCCFLHEKKIAALRVSILLFLFIFFSFLFFSYLKLWLVYSFVLF